MARWWRPPWARAEQAPGPRRCRCASRRLSRRIAARASGRRSAAAAGAVGEEDVVDAADPRRVVEEWGLHHADRLRAGELHAEGRREPPDVLGRGGGLGTIATAPLVTVPDEQA